MLNNTLPLFKTITYIYIYIYIYKYIIQLIQTEVNQWGYLHPILGLDCSGSIQ